MDTAIAIRLRRLIEMWEARLDHILKNLGWMAKTHADLAIAARTYGHVATPTCFGAAVKARVIELHTGGGDLVTQACQRQHGRNLKASRLGTAPDEARANARAAHG